MAKSRIFNRRLHCWLALGGFFMTNAATAAASSAPQSIHDPRTYELVWSEPPGPAPRVREQLVYDKAGERELTFDVAAPAGLLPSELRPTVIFLLGSGEDTNAGSGAWKLDRSWLEIVARRGLVGIRAEIDDKDPVASLEALVRHLAKNASDLGADSSRLALLASSGKTGPALRFLMSDPAPAGARAAVLFYGPGPAPRVRNDLPVLLLIAGKDLPDRVAAEHDLARVAVSAGAPWTILEAPGLSPAFEAFDIGDESRAAIAQTLAFLDAHLKPLPPPPAEAADRAAARRALSQLYRREFEAAHDYYNELVAGEAQRDRQAWENLAWARRGMGSVAGEAIALEQAIFADPGNVGLRRRAGRLAGRYGRWGEVEETLAPVISSPELDAIDLGLLGLARLLLGQPADAIGPLERAAAIGGDVANQYNLACAYARVGRIDDAFAELNRAIDEGFEGAKLLAEDPDLTSLRADPRFAALAARLPSAPQPALATPTEPTD